MEFELAPDGFVDMDSVPDEPVDLDLAVEADLPPLPEATWMRLLAVARDPAMHDPAVDDLVHASADEGGAENGQSASAGLTGGFHDDVTDPDREISDDLAGPFSEADDALAERVDPADESLDGPEVDPTPDLGP